MKIMDFEGSDEFHRADHDGRSCQAASATFPPRKRTFRKRLRRVEIIFRAFVRFLAWFSTIEILDVTKVGENKKFTE